MAETPACMTADTFKARLRLGHGFMEAVHVLEALKIEYSSITHLCDTLSVDGDLDLTGCVSLTTLPSQLTVRGRLIIDGCTQITTLPMGLRRLQGFSAIGCHQLKSIAPLLECHGSINLTGCSSMAPLSSDFRWKGKLTLSQCWIDSQAVFVETSALPDTVLAAALGRPIGDIISHPLLAGHPILDAVVIDTMDFPEFEMVIFFIDTLGLMIPDCD